MYLCTHGHPSLCTRVNLGPGPKLSLKLLAKITENYGPDIFLRVLQLVYKEACMWPTTLIETRACTYDHYKSTNINIPLINVFVHVYHCRAHFVFTSFSSQIQTDYLG